MQAQITTQATKVQAAWGPPTETGMFPTWVNDEAGYEASMLELGRFTRVDFAPFVPLRSSAMRCMSSGIR